MEKVLQNQKVHCMCLGHIHKYLLYKYHLRSPIYHTLNSANFVVWFALPKLKLGIHILCTAYIQYSAKKVGIVS